jgi:hypothetical protein
MRWVNLLIGAVSLSRVNHLAYVSWSYILDHLEDPLKKAGEDRSVHELWQLRGLCERLAENKSLPTDHREKLRLIVNDVAMGLEERNIFQTKGYRAVPEPTSYRRYGTMRDRIN